MKLKFLPLISMALFLFSFPSCDNSIASEACPHKWNEATCASPKNCILCDVTEGKPLGHIYSEGKCSVCEKNIYRWFDADNKLLYEKISDNTIEATYHELPKDDEKWDYIEWRETAHATFTGYRIPKRNYFIGNVFQIIVKNLETPIGTGSGFVFNDEGWFISNAHVMQNAYNAQAIFEIPNEQTGESFTYLDINEGTYYNLDKDIYIGKIENYNSIKAYYQSIPVSSNYEIGDTTYSIGYPNSTALLKINEGIGVMEYATLADKLYSGNTYIYSTSYIAPGSSGGILVNDNLEVIGITTRGLIIEEEFIVGAATTTFNFKNLLSNIRNSDLVTLEERFYDDYTTTINLFNQAKTDYTLGKATRYILDDGTPYYHYQWLYEDVNDDGDAYTCEESLFIFSDGLLLYNTDYYWADGSRRILSFYGYYSDIYEFSMFTFEFYYKWSSGDFYEIYCDNINYSQNISLTLKNAQVSDKSYGYIVSDSNISYAKEQFNYMFEYLKSYMSQY